MEAITSWPLLLAALGRDTHSDGQTTLCLVSGQAYQCPDVVEDRIRPNGMMRHEVWNLQAFQPSVIAQFARLACLSQPTASDD